MGGYINVMLSKRDIDNVAYIMIDIENTKFEVKRYDLKELKRLTKLIDFAKIMSSNVDLNHKLAKIISNA